MIQKELLKMPVSDLVPYENNPRVISPAAVDACAESIKQCSALDPIEVDENNVILSGHTRRLALMQLNVDMADVVRYTGLTEEQKQKYRLLANKTGEMTGWDFSKLERELLEVVLATSTLILTFRRTMMPAYPTLTALWRTVSQRLRKRKNFP